MRLAHIKVLFYRCMNCNRICFEYTENHFFKYKIYVDKKRNNSQTCFLSLTKRKKNCSTFLNFLKKKPTKPYPIFFVKFYNAIIILTMLQKAVQEIGRLSGVKKSKSNSCKHSLVYTRVVLYVMCILNTSKREINIIFIQSIPVV